MNPRAFLELAKVLAAGSTAAQYRTAISRAYYAVFNTCVEILDSLGCNIWKSPSAHGQIRDYLNNAGNDDLSLVSSQLRDLHMNRIKADYRLQDLGSETSRAAFAAVSQATRMLQLMERCTTGPNRNAIIQAIADYRLKTNR